MKAGRQDRRRSYSLTTSTSPARHGDESHYRLSCVRTLTSCHCADESEEGWILSSCRHDGCSFFSVYQATMTAIWAVTPTFQAKSHRRHCRVSPECLGSRDLSVAAWR